MKFIRAIIAVIAFCSATHFVVAQGTLTPQGPPGPTMITLSQVEPRTPVDATHTPSGGSAQFLITQSGSYYLTTNIVSAGNLHGINISASNVSLDLNGFSLVGISNSYDGIYIHSGYQNITVRNGIISGWGASAGTVGGGGNPGAGILCYANNAVFDHLTFSSNTPSNGIDVLANSCSVIDCTVSSNVGYGVYVLTNGTVRDCTADANSGGGISVGYGCSVMDCAANGNGGVGINVANNCTVNGCTANGNGPNGDGSNGINTGNNCTVNGCTANGDFIGIAAVSNCVVSVCTASGNYTAGISVGNNCLVNDCSASDNSGALVAAGITAAYNCIVKNCTANGNEGSGVTAGSNCVVLVCTLNGNNVGIYLTYNNCIVKDCTANGNSTDGIVVNGNSNLISGNDCSANADGIVINGPQNRVDGNTAGNNTSYGIYPYSVNVTNSITRNTTPGNGTGGYYNTSGNNDYAPIQTPSTATSPWANF